MSVSPSTANALYNMQRTATRAESLGKLSKDAMTRQEFVARRQGEWPISYIDCIESMHGSETEVYIQLYCPL